MDKIVNICGIPHKVIEKEDAFDVDLHFGQINYATAEIFINKNATSSIKKESICHEMVHGILVHIGRQDLSNDETFVQSFGNALARGFDIILCDKEE